MIPNNRTTARRIIPPLLAVLSGSFVLMHCLQHNAWSPTTDYLLLVAGNSALVWLAAHFQLAPQPAGPTATVPHSHPAVPDLPLPTPRLQARFYPHAWVNPAQGEAVRPAEPKGPVVWLLSEPYASSVWKLYGGRLTRETWMHQDTLLSTIFIHDPAVPGWIRWWCGPFACSVEVFHDPRD